MIICKISIAISIFSTKLHKFYCINYSNYEIYDANCGDAIQKMPKKECREHGESRCRAARIDSRGNHVRRLFEALAEELKLAVLIQTVYRKRTSDGRDQGEHDRDAVDRYVHTVKARAVDDRRRKATGDDRYAAEEEVHRIDLIYEEQKTEGQQRKNGAERAAEITVQKCRKQQ